MAGKKTIVPEKRRIFYEFPLTEKEGDKRKKDQFKKPGKKKPPAIELPEVFQKKSFPVKGPC